MRKRFDRRVLWMSAGAAVFLSAPLAGAVAQEEGVIDGEPTLQVCAELGFRLPGYLAPVPILRTPPPALTPAPMPSPAPRITVAPPQSEIDQCYAEAKDDEAKLTICDQKANAVTAIVSNGSRIRGLPEDAALPVEVLGRERLEERGAPNMADMLKSITEASSAPNPQNGGTGYGDAQVNLRGMGSGRTLGLVNGRRLGDAAQGAITQGNSQDVSRVPYGSIAGAGYFGPQYDPYSERYPRIAAQGFKQAREEPVSTFSIDVDTAAYANVRRFLTEGNRPPKDAVRLEELINYFDYGYSPPGSVEQPFSTHLAVTPSPWSNGRQLIHIGVQGFKPAGPAPPLNLVFLVDTSGSMMEADRLPLAQKSLGVLIDQLRPQDKVSMVAYAGSAGAVLAPTGGREKLKMRCAVNGLQAGGSTAGGAGLKLAYDLAQQNFEKGAVNRVILMTDGDFNVGVTDNKSLEDFVSDKRKTGVYLSVYGFGRGNYQDARMQVLAQNGNGTAAYVDSFEESKKLFRDDFSRSLFPIADDVKIQVEFNPGAVAEYRLIGYETRLLRREDFNNDAIDAGEVGTGASVTALYEVTPVGGRRSIDPLRYGGEGLTRPAAAQASELAYLKIRYKSPGGTTSRLMERAIGARETYASLGRAPEATRWAIAVAAYGQKLRDEPYLSSAFGWEQVLDLAQGARGDDPSGARAEMLRLVRTARTLREQNAGL